MKVKGQLCLQTHIELMSASQCLGAFVSVAEAQGWNKTLCMPKKHMKIIFFQLVFTPCKAEQPLRSMELQEKEAQKG